MQGLDWRMPVTLLDMICFQVRCPDVGGYIGDIINTHQISGGTRDCRKLNTLATKVVITCFHRNWLEFGKNLSSSMGLTN